MPDLVGIDVIELVDDGIELGHPVGGTRIEIPLARPFERLIAEAREHERDQVLDRGIAELNDGRLGDEPLRSARQLAGQAIAPEEVAGLALWKRQAVAGRERAFSLGAAEAREDEDLRQVDERKTCGTPDDVLHQERDTLGVVDHPDTRCRKPETTASPVPVPTHPW